MMIKNKKILCALFAVLVLVSFVNAEQVEEITLEGHVGDILEGSFLIENELEDSILVSSFTTNEATFNFNYKIEFSEEDEFTLDSGESEIIYFKITPGETMIRQIEIIGEISHADRPSSWWGRPTYVIVNLIIEEDEEQIENELIEELRQEDQKPI
jgi:hypothetical protein